MHKNTSALKNSKSLTFGLDTLQQMGQNLSSCCPDQLMEEELEVGDHDFGNGGGIVCETLLQILCIHYQHLHGRTLLLQTCCLDTKLLLQ